MMLVVSEITKEVRALCDHAARTKPQIPFLETKRTRHALRSGLWFTPDLTRAAHLFSEACALDLDGPTVSRAALILPPMVFTALILTLGARLGIERVEKVQAIPARSGKLLVYIALNEIIRQGVVRV